MADLFRIWDQMVLEHPFLADVNPWQYPERHLSYTTLTQDTRCRPTVTDAINEIVTNIWSYRVRVNPVNGRTESWVVFANPDDCALVKLVYG